MSSKVLWDEQGSLHSFRAARRRSGSGSDILVVDLNHPGKIDLVTAARVRNLHLLERAPDSPALLLTHCRPHTTSGGAEVISNSTCCLPKYG